MVVRGSRKFVGAIPCRRPKQGKHGGLPYADALVKSNLLRIAQVLCLRRAAHRFNFPGQVSSTRDNSLLSIPDMKFTGPIGRGTTRPLCVHFHRL
jgi:hypothetical protein